MLIAHIEYRHTFFNKIKRNYWTCFLFFSVIKKEKKKKGKTKYKNDVGQGIKTKTNIIMSWKVGSSGINMHSVISLLYARNWIVFSHAKPTLCGARVVCELSTNGSVTIVISINNWFFGVVLRMYTLIRVELSSS